MTSTMTVADREVDRLTYANYRTLLDQTIASYPIVGFDVVINPELANSHFALLRHDIDLSPQSALPIAELEAARGVRSTYMVLLTSEFYNAFERRNVDTLKKIAALGHDIGLHFDAAWHGIGTEVALEADIRREARILQELVGTPITCFSFHNTTTFTMDCRNATYAGLYNAYAGVLQDKVDYVSDSNGMWRFHNWRELLDRKSKRVQILTHPEWWPASAGFASSRVAAIIMERAEGTWERYCKVLAEAGRVNEAEIAPAISHALRSDRSEAYAVLLQWLSGQEAGALVTLARLLDRNVDVASAMAPVIAELSRGGDPDRNAMKHILTEGMSSFCGGAAEPAQGD